MFESLAADATRLCHRGTANATVLLAGDEYRVRWDDAYTLEIGVSSSEIRATFLDADDAPLEEGAVITKGAAQYKIREIQPDGMGLTVCVLSVTNG